jgi:membrane protease YdiL (CAAX protease family)
MVIEEERAVNDFVAYMVLASFPVLAIFLLEPTGARWGAKHKSFALPPEVRQRSERNGRFLWLVRYVILILVCIFFARRYPIAPSMVMPATRPFTFTLLAGVSGGMLLLACRSGMRFAFAGLASNENQYDLLKGPAIFWLITFILGGFAEELWRASSILALIETDHTVNFAIVVSSIAFGLGRLGGIPSRIHGETVDTVAEVLTGIILGGLYVWSRSVLAASLASIIYYTSLFYFLRRHRQPNGRPQQVEI